MFFETKIKFIKNILLDKRSRPDFFIVGAQKCGTTSLHDYLSNRKGFCGSKPKEVHYFDREERFQKSIKWYESHFGIGSSQFCLNFEATPTYLHRKKVPTRIFAYNPDAKIIILLREPVSRAYSAWNMYRQWSEEGFIPSRMRKDVKQGRRNNIYRIFFDGGCPSFHDYIKIEMGIMEQGGKEDEPSLIRRGLYKQQIERYVDLFGREKVLVLGFNELKKNSEAVIRKCHTFLGVPYREAEGITEKAIKNKRDYPSKINSSDYELLQKFYEKHNKELFEYLGFQPDW